MEGFKSSNKNEEEDGSFVEAFDEFPFYGNIESFSFSQLETVESDAEVSSNVDAFDELPLYDSVESFHFSQVEPVESGVEVSSKSEPLSELHYSSGLRRRRSIPRHARERRLGDDSSTSNLDSQVDVRSNGTKNDAPSAEKESKEVDPVSVRASAETDTRSTIEQNIENSVATSANNARVVELAGSKFAMDRKHRLSRKLKEKRKGIGKPDSLEISEGANHGAGKESVENSAVTIAKDERIVGSIAVDSGPSEVHEPSASNFLVFLAELTIKAIGFQINLWVMFFTFPILLLNSSYLFVTDPFGFMRRCRGYLTSKLLRLFGVTYESLLSFVREWLKEHKSIWTQVFRAGWGLLWASYVCFVLISLMFSAFVVSGMITWHLVEEPIQMKQSLTFDYTKNNPVALVPFAYCPDEPHGLNSRENMEIGKLRQTRVIPPNHKLQVTVSLTLPESDYNRNLGIFQVRVDFLSATGKALSGSSQPCMLYFKSEPIRLLLTSLKVVPLLTGYASESQTLHVKFKGFTERDEPTACLRIMIEQRAEFGHGAGVPEIYSASLFLESEQPLPKRIIWYWRRTIFIWIGMTMFTVELLFALLCCRSIVMPKVSTRFGSVINNSS